MLFIWETGIPQEISGAAALCGGMGHPPTTFFSLFKKST